MAWAVSNNAWADRVDGEEDTAPPPLFGGAPAPALQESAFPSLGDAAAMPQPTKKEKKKGGKPAKMSLADFNSGAYKPPVQASGPSYGSRRRAEMRDEDIMSMLPKGPAGYSAEDQGGNRLGGGFKGYGGDRGGGGGFGDRARDAPRRGFGDRDRDDEEEREDEGPSRADMDDDWGASRKFVPSNGPSRGGGGGGGFDRDRRGGYDDDRAPREDMGPSRADESDNWGKDRKPLPAPEPRGGGFDRGGGSRGFSDYGPDRGVDRDMGPSRADTEETWGRRAPLPSNDRAPPPGPSKADTEDRWSRAPAPAPTSSQAPAAERPRLKLAPRTKPIENPPPPKPEPTPAAAPAPAEPRAPKANPFGTARPREEVLKEQGKDPIKEDLKLEAAGFIRDDTPEEAKLKEELEELKKKAEGGEDVKEAIAAKETDIETLRLAINDKLRFAQKKAEADKAGDGAAAEEEPAAKEAAPAEEK